ncbi:MAG TPA: hypothetical protein VLD18_10375, partial [Verrucomicrobiae bacterium]|nr:hypothetical protein [Verrucomicrobiae bacterium]
MKIIPLSLTLLLFAQSAGSPLTAAVLRVRPGAAGGNSGDSWLNAVPSLATALNQAVAGDELWVALGSHQAPAPTLVNPAPVPPFPFVPDPLDNATVAFLFPAGVRVLGGFAGTEDSAGQRDPAVNLTRLVAACLNGARAAFVFKSEAELLDGFVIDGQSLSAGGMSGAGNVIRECTFRFCRAAPPPGGQHFGRPGAALTTTGRVERCVMEFNISTSGAAVWAQDATLIQCRIVNNRNLGDTLGSALGGGVRALNATLGNCLIALNRIEAARPPASSLGGGIYGGARLVNCTIAANVILHPVAGGALGSGAYLQDNGEVWNSIVWGNVGGAGSQFVAGTSSTVSHSVIPGGYQGAGNLGTDPQFNDSSNGDFRLAVGSPARDAGTLTELPLLSERDLDGKWRVIDADGDGLARG